MDNNLNYLNTELYQKSPYLKSILSKDTNVLTETERIYYAIKLIHECDKLQAMKAMPGIPYTEIEKYNGIRAVLKSKIRELSKDFKVSSIFGEVIDDTKFDSHPYIKSLESSKLNGRSYEDAADILCKGLKVNPVTFANFALENEIAYPKVDKSNPAFAEGTSSAKQDGRAASIAKAYRWAERSVPGSPGTVDNFVAGYLQAYRATNEEVDRERKKLIIRRYGTQDDADALLAKKLTEMAKLGAI